MFNVNLLSLSSYDDDILKERSKLILLLNNQLLFASLISYCELTEKW